MSKFRNKSNNLTTFEKQVLQAVRKIPRGKITTYRFLAKAIGRPKAVRAVAKALGKNPCLIKVPCHRVVRSDGQIGGYKLGVGKKIFLLKKEGIKFRRVNQIDKPNKYLFKF